MPEDEEKIKGYIKHWEKERQKNLKNNNIARAVGCELLIKDLKRRIGEELEEN